MKLWHFMRFNFNVEVIFVIFNILDIVIYNFSDTNMFNFFNEMEDMRILINYDGY